MNEGIVGNIGKRSLEKLQRKEDNINNYDKDDFYNYLTTHYKVNKDGKNISNYELSIVIPYLKDEDDDTYSMCIVYNKDLFEIKRISISEMCIDVFDIVDIIGKYFDTYADNYDIDMVGKKGKKIKNSDIINFLNDIIDCKQMHQSISCLYKIDGVLECDCVSPNGGLTFGDVAGMGPGFFPGPNGEPGSGDLPMPSGKLYYQIEPLDTFLKNKSRKKKRRKKFRKEDEPCVHTPNKPVYAYVDDFRDYVDRTYDNIDRLK